MNVNTIIDTVVQFVMNEPTIAVAPLAVVVAWLASWFLYVVLGKRYLGADDDYWEVIRQRLLPLVDAIGRRYGLYAKSHSLEAEYAGYVMTSESHLENRLEAAGYLRQPLSSLHVSPEGWVEDGSWARIYGPVLPIVAILERIPYLGVLPAKFLRAADTIFALKQVNVVFYKKEDRIHIFAHTEYNPLNPVVAPFHYAGLGFRPAPGKIEGELKEVGVKVRR